MIWYFQDFPILFQRCPNYKNEQNSVLKMNQNQMINITCGWFLRILTKFYSKVKQSILVLMLVVFSSSVIWQSYWQPWMFSCIAWGLPLATPSCQFYINCLHDVLTAALQTSVPVPRGLGLRQHKMRHCFVEWRAQRTSIHMLYT